MLNCHKKYIKDLTQRLGHFRHFYCVKCKAHSYKDKIYTKKEWDNYVDFNPKGYL